MQPHFDPDKTTLQWVLEEYPKLSETALPLECTVGPGEVTRITLVIFCNKKLVHIS